jgi:hypothetical protein
MLTRSVASICPLSPYLQPAGGRSGQGACSWQDSRERCYAKGMLLALQAQPQGSL